MTLMGWPWAPGAPLEADCKQCQKVAAAGAQLTVCDHCYTSAEQCTSETSSSAKLMPRSNVPNHTGHRAGLTATTNFGFFWLILLALYRIM